MTNEFDAIVESILAKKIEKRIQKAKKKKLKLVKKLIGKEGKPNAPNTPGNRPASNQSPALHKGINKDFSDTPMPLGVGV